MGSSFADKLAARKAKAEGSPPPTPTPDSVPVVAAVEAAAQPAIKEATNDAPPWANPDCMACHGKGFNARGNACQVCNAKAAVLGRPPSSSFDITTAAGVLTWTEKGSETPTTGSTDSTSSQTPVKQQAAVDTPKPPEPTPEPDSVVVEEKPNVKKGAKKKELSKGGRPRKGFTLCVNTVPISGTTRTGAGRGIFRLDQVLLELGQEMATQAGVESFFDLDVWDRRTKLAMAAEGLAEQFSTDFVVALGVTGGTDLKALVDALRPHAGMEIISCNG